MEDIYADNSASHRQYSQVKQAGLAYTEDLNILQDRGIPIYKALAEELDINTADVKKWASEGKISADIYQGNQRLHLHRCQLCECKEHSRIGIFPCQP